MLRVTAALAPDRTGQLLQRSEDIVEHRHIAGGDVGHLALMQRLPPSQKVVTSDTEKPAVMMRANSTDRSGRDLSCGNAVQQNAHRGDENVPDEIPCTISGSAMAMKLGVGVSWRA